MSFSAIWAVAFLRTFDCRNGEMICFVRCESEEYMRWIHVIIKVRTSDEFWFEAELHLERVHKYILDTVPEASAKRLL